MGEVILFRRRRSPKLEKLAASIRQLIEPERVKYFYLQDLRREASYGVELPDAPYCIRCQQAPSNPLAIEINCHSPFVVVYDSVEEAVEACTYIATDYGVPWHNWIAETGDAA